MVMAIAGQIRAVIRLDDNFFGYPHFHSSKNIAREIGYFT